MQALTVVPGHASSAKVRDEPEPDPSYGALLLETRAVGVCGTDLEIVGGEYGEAPPGESRLVIGHEALGEIADAPEASGFGKGDLVVGIVRRPDPVPCANCALGEWDMCRNGRYTERGIKGLHGFASERFRLEPEFAIKIDRRLDERGVLLEPASVVAKAWDHVERIGRRAHYAPSRVLVTGAGPIGLLAALLGVQRGLEVHVFDRVVDGPKPELVRTLGASYRTGDVASLGKDWDIVLECTGAAALVFAAFEIARANGIVCLTGVSSGGHAIPLDVGALNRELVLENNVVFGSVNANRSHYELAASALAAADQAWLGRLITRRVPLASFASALERQPNDVKPILVFDR